MCVSNGCVHCQSIRDSFAQYCSVAASVCCPIQIGSANLRSVSPSMLSIQKIIYAPRHFTLICLVLTKMLMMIIKNGVLVVGNDHIWGAAAEKRLIIHIASLLSVNIHLYQYISFSVPIYN